MFDEFSRFKGPNGWIEVIVGCMFSGKTEELIKQIRRAEIAKLKVQAFKPRIDSRYSADDVTSHNQTRAKAIPVNDVQDILRLVLPETEVVAIDEGQFFSVDIIDVALVLADTGKRVIISGLDTDWRGRPFGPMPQLMAVAEVVRKQYAVCPHCGAPATRTQRLIAAQDDILVGSTEAYEARCRLHFDPDLGLRSLTEREHDLTLAET